MDFKNISFFSGKKTTSNLNYAVRQGHLEKVRDLITSFDFSDPEAWSKGYGLVCDAVRNDHRAIIKLLLANGAKVNSEIRNSSNTPLHFAVINGDVEIVEMLLSKNANYHAKNKDGLTPLHYAVEYEDMKMIEVLLYWGADINTTDDEGKTCLHIASEIGHLEIIEYLLRHGAKVDSVYNPSYVIESYTPLYLAVIERHEKVVDLLLAYGANVDNLIQDGKTVLSFAVQKRYTRIVDNILKHCPDVNNKSNRRSLESAVCGYGEECRYVCERLLAYGFTVDPEDVNNWELLHAAIEKGYFNIIEDLLKYGMNINMLPQKGYDSALHIATKTKQEEIVEQFIHFKADVNVKDIYGNPPIFYAVRNSNVNIFKILLDNGAEVENNSDLLNVAVAQRCKEIVEILVRSIININACDKYRRTVLHFLLNRDYFWCLDEIPDIGTVGEIAKLLLRYGADINAQDYQGVTALHLAVQEGCGELVQILLANNADVNTTARFSMTPVQFSLENRKKEINKGLLNVKASQTDGTTALHIAAKKGYLEIVDALLKSGADKNVRNMDDHGRTALHLSSKQGHEEVVAILLKSGADVDATDDYGMKALHLASGRGHAKVVDVLLKYGAEIDDSDKHGRTALHIASVEERVGIVENLLKCGADTDLKDEYGRKAFDLAEKVGEEKVIKALNESFVMMQAAKYFIDAEGGPPAKKIRLNPLIPNEVFIKEIKKMKKHKISSNNITLFDILDTKPLVKYARNEEIFQTIGSYDFIKHYPIYGRMIKNNFEVATKRKNLLDEICPIFRNLCKYTSQLPHNCLEKILSYLCNRDLRVLIQVCKPTNLKRVKRCVDNIKNL